MPDWLAFSFALLFAIGAVRAVRTGKLKPSLYDRVYLRSEEPGTFWFHVGVYVVVACAFIAAAATWM
jgi:hypothetical protein